MLNLQAGNLSDERALTPLRESQDRVRTLALIHEKLYFSRDLSSIAFKGYLEALTGYLLQVHGSGRGRVTLRLDLDEAFLTIDTAIPVALAVTELITNSLKHAFPDGRDGEVGVELRQVEPHSYLLVLRDDGVGFPDGVDFRSTDSLGLQLVCILVQQIRGSIELDRSAGTRFAIAFSEPALAAP